MEPEPKLPDPVFPHRWIWASMLFISLAVLAAGCGTGPDTPSPEVILRDIRFDLITDAPYMLPANKTEDGATVHLPVRRWDIIFVGISKSGVRTGVDPVLLTSMIPGLFDHILIYIGKDANGYAYAVELNTDDVQKEGFRAIVTGGHRFMCLGKDYGTDLHPTGEQVIRRDLYGVRWARTFSEADRTRLLAADAVLMNRIRTDMLGKFPYELEFTQTYEGFLADRTIRLVDDGLNNGAGCADYWTTLYEEYAGLCMKGVRMTAADVMDYFTNDPVGKTAYLPPYLNPLGTGNLPFSTAISLGVKIVDDAPHRFSCDGTEETGLVLPDVMMKSPSLVDILPVP